VQPYTIVCIVAQLPKAPEVEAAAAAADAAARDAAERAAREADVAALRSLRMGLRDVTTRLLCDRRWRAFAEPVTAEEDPEYLALVRFPVLGYTFETLQNNWTLRGKPAAAGSRLQSRSPRRKTQSAWSWRAFCLISE